MTPATRHALRCLRHPVTLVAVAVLVVNDHVLKDSAAPGWLTGKLSDLAGVFFFPFLVAALLGLAVRRPRPAGLAAFVVTGAWFAAAKAVPAAHALTVGAIEAVVGARPFVRLDPSDLLALAALPLAWRLWETVDAVRAPRWRSVVAVAVAGLAALATTPYDPSVEVLAVEGDTVTAWIGDAGDFALEDGYVSEDGGQSWRRAAGEAAQPPDDRPAVREVCAPVVPNECYRVRRGRYRDRLERSIDGGRTWVPTFREPYLLRSGAAMRVADLAIVPQGGSYAIVAALGVNGVAARPDGGDWQAVAVGPTGPLHRPNPFSDRITGPAVWAAFLGLGVWGTTLYMSRPSGRRGRRETLPSPETGRWTVGLVGVMVAAVVLAFTVREALLRLAGEGALLEPNSMLFSGVVIGVVALGVAAAMAARFQANVLELRAPPAWWWSATAAAVWVVATYQIVDSVTALV